MATSTDFQKLLDEILGILKNLNKDNLARRTDELIISRKLEKLDELKQTFLNLKNVFNESKHSQEKISEVKGTADLIVKYFKEINDIIQDRLDNIKKSAITETANMAEKFCLKTAGSLLPIMDNKEDTTKQLIDAIELYDSMLDEGSKKILIAFVIKTRLSQSAKLKLKSTYLSIEELSADLKKHFIITKSPTQLSLQLNRMKQNHLTIDQFGRKIEELLEDLTISQANGNTNILDVLRSVNEKVAVSVFANGLQSNELRTIVKARNYVELSEAIKGAKEEEPMQQQNSHELYHFNHRGNYNKKRGNSFNYNPNRGNYNKTTQYQNNSRNNSNNFTNSNKFNQNYRGNAARPRRNQFYRSGNSNRGNSYNNGQNANRYGQQTQPFYYAETDSNVSSHFSRNEPTSIGQSSTADNTFFRDESTIRN